MEDLKIDWAKVDAACALYDETDKELEIFCQLGSSWSVNRKTVPPFVLGHVPLLRMIESPLMCGGPMTDDDALKALTIAMHGRSCVSMLFAERHLGEPLFSTACLAVRDEVVGGIGADYTQIKNVLCGMFNASMRAFDFLPKSDGEKGNGLDAQWFAWICSTAADKMRDNVERVTWEYPLGMVAFCLIEKLDDIGLNVRRPVDDAKQMAEIKRQVEAQDA